MQGPAANHWVLPHVASRACWVKAEWWEAAGVPHHSCYGQVFWGPGHAGCFVCWCVRKGSQGLAACLQHGAVWSTAVLLGQSSVSQLQVGKLCIQGRASGPVVGKSLPVLHGELGGRGGKLEGASRGPSGSFLCPLVSLLTLTRRLLLGRLWRPSCNGRVCRAFWRS